MKRLFSILGLGLLLGLILAPQAALADSVNGGFEDGGGSLTGWTPTGQTSVTSAGYDPRAGGTNLPMVGVGSHSAKVGDQNAYAFSGVQTSTLRQSWTVGSTFTDLYFGWAAVGLVPTNTNHNVADTPWFQIKVNWTPAGGVLTNLVTDQHYTGDLYGGNSIQAGWLQGVTNTSGLGQDDDGIWYYRPWTTFHLDLAAQGVLAGDTLEVILETRDCNLSGHAMYAYLDGFGDTEPVIPTPEPGTLVLLGCALGGLYGIRRKVS